MSDSLEAFALPAPFNLGEVQPDVLPPHVYTKAELTNYLAHGRDKCRATIAALKDEKAVERFGFEWVRRRSGSSNTRTIPGWVIEFRDDV